MQNVVIFGGTSAIAQSVARLYAARGDKIFLVARNQVRLTSIKKDLTVQGASACHYATQDLADTSQHESLIQTIVDEIGNIDVALIAHGTLPDQESIQDDFNESLAALQINGISVISLMTQLANHMGSNKQGTIAVISSVAGDRGRQSNYVYGTAKAMVSTFAQGLRNRMEKQGVHVLTIKPGFVDTPMTAEFDKGALWAQPEQVANEIVKAVDKKKNVLYTPFFWRWIMLIITNIPEFIFKKLSL